MKILIKILILSLICFSVKAQQHPSGLPIIKSSGYYQLGWIKTDSGVIVAVNDTSFIPRFIGTEVIWLHSGVDTSIWVYNGAKWNKQLKSGDIAPTVWGNITGTLSNQTDLQSALNLKLNITDTTGKWIGIGKRYVDTAYRVNDSTLAIRISDGIGNSNVTNIQILGGSGGGGGGSGTVTNVATGYGLSGGPITTTGTILVDSATLSSYYLRRKDSVLYQTKYRVDTMRTNVYNGLNGKQNSLTLTTTGSSGAATLIGNTLNIPQYAGGGSDSGVIVGANSGLTKTVAGTTIILKTDTSTGMGGVATNRSVRDTSAALRSLINAGAIIVDPVDSLAYDAASAIGLNNGNVAIFYTGRVNIDMDFSPAQLFISEWNGHSMVNRRQIFPDGTFTAGAEVAVANPFRINHDSIALIFTVYISDGNNPTYESVSTDEGATWGAPFVIKNHSRFALINNNRVMRASNGNWYLPYSLGSGGIGDPSSRYDGYLLRSHNGIVWDSITSVHIVSTDTLCAEMAIYESTVDLQSASGTGTKKLVLAWRCRSNTLRYAETSGVVNDSTFTSDIKMGITVAPSPFAIKSFNHRIYVLANPLPSSFITQSQLRGSINLFGTNIGEREFQIYARVAGGNIDTVGLTQPGLYFDSLTGNAYCFQSTLPLVTGHGQLFFKIYATPEMESQNTGPVESHNQIVLYGGDAMPAQQKYVSIYSNQMGESVAHIYIGNGVNSSNQFIPQIDFKTSANVGAYGAYLKSTVGQDAFSSQNSGGFNFDSYSPSGGTLTTAPLATFMNNQALKFAIMPDGTPYVNNIDSAAAQPDSTALGWNQTTLRLYRWRVHSGSGGGGSSTLAGLSDVNITSPTNGQSLVYNSGTSKWENAAGSVSGSGTTNKVPIFTGSTALGNSDLAFDGVDTYSFLTSKLRVNNVFSVKNPSGSEQAFVSYDVGAAIFGAISANTETQLWASGGERMHLTQRGSSYPLYYQVRPQLSTADSLGIYSKVQVDSIFASGGGGNDTLKLVNVGTGERTAYTGHDTLYTKTLLGGTGVSVTTGSDSTITISLSGASATSGTYTPTISNTSNINSSTARLCHWTRIGDEVTVTGAVSLSITSGPSTFNLSLPTGLSTFSDQYKLSGVATSGDGSADQSSGTVKADTGNGIALFYLATPVTNPSGVYYFTFTYTYVAP